MEFQNKTTIISNKNKKKDVPILKLHDLNPDSDE